MVENLDCVKMFCIFVVIGNRKLDVFDERMIGLEFPKKQIATKAHILAVEGKS